MVPVTLGQFSGFLIFLTCTTAPGYFVIVIHKFGDLSPVNSFVGCHSSRRLLGWGGQDCCHPGGDSILGSPGLETASWILEAASWVGIVKVALDSFLEFWADPWSLGEPRFW